MDVSKDSKDDIVIETKVPENIPNIVTPKEIISKNIPPKKTELSVENKKDDFNLYSWKSVDTDTSVIISYLQGRNCVLSIFLVYLRASMLDFLLLCYPCISVCVCGRVCELSESFHFANLSHPIYLILIFISIFL